MESICDVCLIGPSGRDQSSNDNDDDDCNGRQWRWVWRLSLKSSISDASWPEGGMHRTGCLPTTSPTIAEQAEKPDILM
eukprot:3480304-Ditylum_brightwellii.AAC.1